MDGIAVDFLRLSRVKDTGVHPLYVCGGYGALQEQNVNGEVITAQDSDT